MANIKDVAKLAGVSVTTVSRVLNNKGYISQDTYESVYRAIDQLDYVPNQIARNLFKQKSYYISLIVPDSSHPFWAEITKYIERKLYKHHYKLFLCNTGDTEDKERDYIKMMRENMVDGIILGTHMLAETEYQNLDLPIVAFDYRVAEDIPTIYSDHNKGGLLAAGEILKNDCKCVLNVTAVVTDKSPSINRHRVFSETLKKNGVKCIEHGVLLDEECVKLMAEKNIPLVTTLSVSLGIADMKGLPEHMMRKAKALGDASKHSFALAHQYGILVALGTDYSNSPNTPFAEIGKEFFSLTRCGYSNMEAIKAGTINGAYLMKSDDKFGSLEAGKLADLVVVDGDPSNDIMLLANAKNVRLVMIGGQIKKNTL